MNSQARLNENYGKGDISLRINGMTCAACVTHVERAILGVLGVSTASVNLATEKASATYNDRFLGTESLVQAILQAGYSAELIDELDEEIEHERLARTKEIKALKVKVIVSVVLSLVIFIGSFTEWFLWVPPFLRNWYVLWILATPVQFWVGAQFYIAAFRASRRRTADMNTLIVIGTSVAYFYSAIVVLVTNIISVQEIQTRVYFDTAAMIITIVLIGRLIEAKAKGYAVESIRSLMKLRPKTAALIRGQNEVVVPIPYVKKGEMVVVRPGESIPLDGEVIYGTSFVNESMLTGESVPIKKNVGSLVYAGTINGVNALYFRVTKIGKDTALSKIIKMVEQAQITKVPVQRLVDRVASYFAPIVIVIAFASFALWFNFGPSSSFNYALLVFVSVLIVACPCALGLAMPMAIMVGTGKGAEHGIFIRNVRVLELAHKIEVVLIDKTGTLTQGEPEVTDIIELGLVEGEILSIAAAAEYGSEHPFGKAIVDEAKARGFELNLSHGFEAFPGYGVKATVDGTEVVVGSLKLMSDLGVDLKKANKFMRSLSLQGKTPIFVSNHGKICGIIGVADRLKDNAGEAIEALYKLGLEVIMLTGDNYDVAEHISRQIHMDHSQRSLKRHIVSSASPKGKLNYVRKLQKSGKVVAMVGDGINDAPALTQADVGIAIGSGVDVAIEASDVTLIGGDLLAVSEAISLSRMTMKTIKQNMFWACIYNIGLIPIAAGILYPIFSNGDVPHLLKFALGEFGFLNPMLAAMAMTLSSITVMGNSLLLRKHLKPNKLDLGKEMS